MYISVYYLLMTLKQLGRAIETPVFYSYQVERLFFDEEENW